MFRSDEEDEVGRRGDSPVQGQLTPQAKVWRGGQRQRDMGRAGSPPNSSTRGVHRVEFRLPFFICFAGHLKLRTLHMWPPIAGFSW